MPLWRYRLADLLTEAGQAVPEPDWPTVPARPWSVTADWRYPEDELEADGTGDDGGGDPVRVFVPVWV